MFEKLRISIKNIIEILEVCVRIFSKNRLETNFEMHQTIKSVMKFWLFDIYPECRDFGMRENGTVGVNFQNYQTEITKNIEKFTV